MAHGVRAPSVPDAPWSARQLVSAIQGEPPPRAPGRIHAVLLPLFDTPEGAALLYTRRSETMRKHPGEVSFPGGRVDLEDADPLAAALREAHEEVGIERAHVRATTHLSEYVTYRGDHLSAYAAWVDAQPPREPASREEVADVFLVRVADLLDPMRYEARALAETPDRRVHYWHVEPYIVWGITGEITARFLRRACGWTPPATTRLIHELPDFMPARRK